MRILELDQVDCQAARSIQAQAQPSKSLLLAPWWSFDKVVGFALASNELGLAMLVG